MEEIFLILDKWTGQSKGCAFVKFCNVQSVNAAIEGLHGKITGPGEARPLIAKWADARKPHESKLRVQGDSDCRRRARSPVGRSSFSPPQLPPERRRSRSPCRRSPPRSQYTLSHDQLYHTRMDCRRRARYPMDLSSFSPPGVFARLCVIIAYLCRVSVST